jgi:hypothetical protein
MWTLAYGHHETASTPRAEGSRAAGSYDPINRPLVPRAATLTSLQEPPRAVGTPRAVRAVRLHGGC